jgi:hypothetical protein
MQEMPDGSHSPIRCGNKLISPAHQNYAFIKLKCLAINHAISKLHFYLRGMQHFQIFTDHKPLLVIFLKDLPAVENRRKQNLRYALMVYYFTLS